MLRGRILATSLLLHLLCLVLIPPDAVWASPIKPHSRTDPAYANWSRLAIQEALSQNYQILDYKYLGSRGLSPSAAEHRFKLWVRKDAEPFALYVNVKYNPITDTLIRIEMNESHP